MLPGDQRQVITKTLARQHQADIPYWGSDHYDPNSNAQGFCVNPDNSDAATLRTSAWRNNWRDTGLSGRTAANVRETAWERDPFVILLQQMEVAVTRKEVSGFALGELAGRTAYAGVGTLG